MIIMLSPLLHSPKIYISFVPQIFLAIRYLFMVCGATRLNLKQILRLNASLCTCVIHVLYADMGQALGSSAYTLPQHLRK